jgi:hypothetical protein
MYREFGIMGGEARSDSSWRGYRMAFVTGVAPRGVCSQRGKEGKPNRGGNDRMHENALKWIEWKCIEIERLSETLTIALLSNCGRSQCSQLPLTIKTGGVWVTVKFTPLTVLTIEIRSKLVRLYRSEVKNGDVMVIYGHFT